MSNKEFTEIEAMICFSARLIEDQRNYFIGVGMPQQAIILAQKLYAPDLAMVYEYGVIAPRCVLPYQPPVGMCNTKSDYKAVSWKNMNNVFFQAHTGYFDYGMLGVNQIDMYGNINSTAIGGDYYHPQYRGAGSGGANEVASWCWRTIAVLMQEKRRFLEKVDFITSPGYLDGSPGAREKAGLPRGTGPYRVVSSMALFGYDDSTRKMKLLGTMPTISVDEVLANMAFEPVIEGKVEELEPPRDEELRLLREEIDPSKLIIGRGKVIRV